MAAVLVHLERQVGTRDQEGAILLRQPGLQRHQPDPCINARGVRALMFSAVPDGDQLGQIAEMVDAGKIRPNIGAVLPLVEAAEAQEMNRTGRVKGKIVLTVEGAVATCVQIA